MSEFKKDVYLLPNYFKKVAPVVFVVSIALLFLTEKHFSPGIGGAQAVIFIKSIAILCFLIFFISEEKDEDELISRIRMKAFASGFFIGVFLYAIWPFQNFLFDGTFSYEGLHTGWIIWMMLFMYIWIYYYLKWSR